MISVVIGEGGSGGALALAVGNRVLMLEHAVYAVLSPEGFASILWKDSSRSGQAAQLMKLTAQDLFLLGAVHQVIQEPPGGAHKNPQATFVAVDRAIAHHLEEVERAGNFAWNRNQVFRNMGSTLRGEGTR